MIAPVVPLRARDSGRPRGSSAPASLLPRAELDRLRSAIGALLDPAAAAIDARLAAAVVHTLEAPGSLWRAQLAWAVGRAARLEEAAALALACAVESFHTASLLFDDLPSMDDGDLRRGRPCAHRLHGEAAATLAALAFVHRGYALLWRGLEGATAGDRRAAGELVESCLGLAGILDGQARDVHFERSGGDEAAMIGIARGKTVTLLRLALVLPAVAAGRAADVRAPLEALADSWGLAYQILDDLGEDGAGPSSPDARQGRPNLALAIGRGRAEARLVEELERAAHAARGLAIALSGCAEPFARLQERLAGALRALPRGLPSARR